MKKVLLLPIFIAISLSVFTQTPNAFKYQAVLRDASGTIMTEENVTVVISILKSDLTTSVFEETHTLTTTKQGLINLNIGSLEDLGGIDWSADNYFIEINVNGSIMGTSQLLSVPYAMHARSVENITESDPVFTTSQAANITATDISNLSNLSGINTGDQDISTLATKTALGDSTALVRSEIPDVSGFLTSETDPTFTSSEAANITATDITNLGNLSGTNTGDQDLSGIATNTQAIIDTAAQIRADIPTVITYSVGDFAQGGIVFWVDETGQHGLVCAKTDQSTAVRWYAGTYGNTQAKGDGPYAGEANTSIIIAAQVAIGDDVFVTYAARICNELQITEGGKTYGDWYLPSKEELNLMYQNKATIDATAGANGGSSFASFYYWSSTELNYTNAWLQTFSDGAQSYVLKYDTHRVRAVRAF